MLHGRNRSPAPAHIEAVRTAPKPQTVRQMLSFLGMVGYSRQWICDVTLKMAPLQALIRAVDQKKENASLDWTPEALTAFEMLKNYVCSGPALAGPNYRKPFHLYVSENQGFANAMLTQQQGPGKHPTAYFSTSLDTVEKGMPPCYRKLAAAAFAYQKASAITMGHPLPYTPPMPSMHF